MTAQHSDDESFLGRWSRLKKENRETVPEPAPQPLPADDSATVQTGLPSTSDGENSPAEPDTDPVRILTDEDMPPLDTLDEHSDYTGFMSTGVSEELRRLALRKLFSAPQFNVRDGLDDYDDDYTSFARLDPDVITADMKYMMEVEARRALEALDKLAASRAQDNTSETGILPAAPLVEAAAEDETADPAPTPIPNEEDSA